MFGTILLIFVGSALITHGMQRKGFTETQQIIACLVYAAVVIGIATLAGLITP